MCGRDDSRPDRRVVSAPPNPGGRSRPAARARTPGLNHRPGARRRPQRRRPRPDAAVFPRSPPATCDATEGDSPCHAGTVPVSECHRGTVHVTGGQSSSVVRGTALLRCSDAVAVRSHHLPRPDPREPDPRIADVRVLLRGRPRQRLASRPPRLARGRWRRAGLHRGDRGHARRPNQPAGPGTLERSTRGARSRARSVIHSQGGGPASSCARGGGASMRRPWDPPEWSPPDAGG
jgi:hypothetical protein